MIYLTNGNMPLNEAYNDEIVQERNNTYQLTFRFPTSDPKWELLREETFLTADDLHGEQDFVIFEIEKQNGYIQVYANQVLSLLNNYLVSAVNADQVTGSRAVSLFAGSITREHPFSFFCDIEDRHTFNIKEKNAMEVLVKDKHSILGQWGGDMVRNGYNLRLLKNGGSENESLFMYKKNLSSYQHKTSTKSLKTRITFKTTVKGEGENAVDQDFKVIIDSPLLSKYSQIYEAVVEVNDQDVKDQDSLIKYGKQYYRTSMCDMMEDSLEISVVGQSDVAVQMFDVVSIYHEGFGLDVRKKITKYTYSPMGKRLKSIGFGSFQSSLASAIGGIVNDAVQGESQRLHEILNERLKKEIANADRAFDAEFAKREKAITDAVEQYKAKAEEVKRELSDTINQRFDNFDNASIQEAKRRAEEALRNAGASSLLAQEAKNISERARTDITNLQASSQNALSQIEAFKTEYGTKLNEFKNTSDGILTKLGAIETYVNKDGQRQESLQRYARDESARQVSAVREQISRDYVGKSTYQENVRGLERRFSAISTQTNNDISTKIAQYKQTVDGQFASITSQIAGKANQTDFQRVRETSQLYERIIGSNENDISNKVARMAMTNKLFQVEVAKNEGLKTVQRQIAGSWAVQNINSAGDLISGINLGANGHNRFDGKLTHITGETLIDKAVIKSAMIDKLKTANFEAGSVTTVVLDAEAVTAEKLKVDQAFFNKFVANEAYLNLLFAKQAFINRVRSISIDASQITTGTLSGDRINGETITGVTLKGNTRIKIGDHGSLDAINGGLQINVPRELNSKDGLGVQFIGSYGRGEDVPYGLFVYKDSDFTTSGYAVDTDDFILTVRGYIKAKGIGWLRTNEGSVGGRTTATIGFWNSNNVSLDFGGSGNDIYYSYNGTAYSLWEIVNNHFSDKRLKENIVACEHQALDYINQFSFKEYDWKKQGDRPQKSHTKIGLIAQEVQEVDDTLVYKNGDTLNLDNLRLTTIALKAIQELDLENRKLTQRLENLENERRTA